MQSVFNKKICVANLQRGPLFKSHAVCRSEHLVGHMADKNFEDWFEISDMKQERRIFYVLKWTGYF